MKNWSNRRTGGPVDQVGDAVRVVDEERFEMAALERPAVVWMRAPEPGRGLETSSEGARQLDQHGYLYALLGLVAAVAIGVALLLWLA